MQNDQHFWNITFTLFFLVLFVNAMVILYVLGIVPTAIPEFDFLLLALATLRLTRLFVYDKIMEWGRDLFLDLKLEGDEYVRVKPLRGPRRTIAELMACPWCMGMWFGLFVSFFYFLTPLAWFPILFLAVGGVGSLFQVLANLVGWKAEELKKNVERL
jgi:hypothetical protein